MSWGAVIGGAVSVVGGYLSKKSSDKGIDRATAASEQAAREANQLQREIWQQGRQDNEPFRQSALTANSALMSLFGLAPQQQAHPTSGGAFAPQGQNMGQVFPTGGATGSGAPATSGFGTNFAPMGLNNQMVQYGGNTSQPSHRVTDFRKQDIPGRGTLRGNFQGLPGYTGAPGATGGAAAPAQSPMQQRQAMFDLWRSTPGYQFNLDEGRKQLESSAAARGGLYSGAALKSLTQYGQNYADRTYDDYVGNLQSMAGVAQTVNSQNAQMGMNYGNNVGANMINAGNTRASGLLQKGQNGAEFASGVAGLVNNGVQNWWQKNQWGGI